MLPRLTVALTFDHDSISDASGAAIRRSSCRTPSSASGSARRGSSRCSRRAASPPTWFVPGHTLETFPRSTDAILAGGHELACHGWFHEDFAELRPDERTRHARALLVRRSSGRGARRGLAGALLVARRARRSSLVEAAGFVYDSSLMADDYRPVPGPRGDRHSVDRGHALGAEASLVEVPVYWAIDDWPHFEPPGSASRRPVGAVEGPRDLDRGAALRTCARARRLLIVTMHPECIGRGHRMAMLERFIDAASALDGVAFERLDTVVDRWAAST